MTDEERQPHAIDPGDVGPGPEPKTMSVPPEYEELVYYLILPLGGTAEPKVNKREPRYSSQELVLRLELAVPKVTKRLIQTLRVQLPMEIAHLSVVDVVVGTEEVQA
jgi:hypothetical protein